MRGNNVHAWHDKILGIFCFEFKKNIFVTMTNVKNTKIVDLGINMSYTGNGSMVCKNA